MPRPLCQARRDARRSWLAAAALVVVTAVVYLPAIRGGFIWNDSDYVTRPDLRSLHGLWRLWTEPGVTDQYYPVLYSAFWLEHRLWGDAAVGYHLLNVLWHALAACLFALVLGRLWDRRWKPAGAEWIAGLVFALHPVCVESVAWITEQKNTLSTVFYLLAALAYLRYDERRRAPPPDGARRRAAFAYALATFLFVLALFSKTVTATLPAALLVVLWWRDGRRRLREAAGPLIPWFALGVAAGLFTAWIERHFVGASGGAFDLTLAERTALAGKIAWFYLGKLMWPSRLIFMYPRWDVRPAGAHALGLVALGAAAIAAWLLIRRRGSSRATRAPLACLLLFVGTLFPALGFFNVYAFIFSFVADHFQYLAALAVVGGLVGGWGWFLAGKAGGLSPVSRSARLAAYYLSAAAAAVSLGALTFRQSGMYRSDEALYRRTLALNPAAWMAQNNLGNVLFAQGDFDAAIGLYRQALRLEPEFADAHYNLANALTKAGRLDEALPQYALAARLDPNDVHVRNDFGAALLAAGEPESAIVQFRAALRLHPESARIYFNLGSAYGRARDLPAAIGCLRAAVRLDPRNAEAEDNLGSALAEAGRWAEAVLHYRRAIGLDADSAGAHRNLSVALMHVGRWREAAEEFETASRLEAGPPANKISKPAD